MAKVAVAILLAGLALAPLPAPAQQGSPPLLRARIVDSTGVPRTGALVLALDPAAGTELARAVTDTEGNVTLRLAVTSVRLRVLSIGQAPSDAGLARVAAGGAPVTVRVGFRPIVLPAVVTSERSQCGRPAGGSAAAVLLAEARTAILLSQSVPAGTPPRATVVRFAYWTGTDGAQQGRPTVTRASGASLRPFQSVPRAVLDAEGFVVEEPDGTVYRAPDASWFTDDRFAGDHCFSLRASSDSSSALVGIAFEPRERARTVQVAGVLWVDSSSFALSHVDYRYIGLDRARASGAGGSIRFAQLPSGLWFEERWELRMPQLRTTLGTPDVARGGRAASTVVDRVRVIGGQVLSLQLGDEVVFANADAGLDSLEAAARAATVAGAAAPAAEAAGGAPGVTADSLVSAACALEPGELVEGEP
ncbi:MAG TPA: carboxypeptidase-like regulatory domain-containing protein, partial [Gemmatimonadaceae bacterium]|nr:carboxypeptidase-like regulatory domain-containing protein [Gemmatimonadaceae bacterium]